MPQKENKTTVKRAFFTVSLLIVSFTVFSQTILLKPSEKYIGFSGGVNTSKVMFIPSVEQNLIFLGYTGGIAYRYITEKNVGLQMELKYAQRGWSETSGKYARQISYIEAPFLTHIYVGNTHRAILNLGPKIGYLLSDKVIKNDAPDLTVEQQKNLRFRFDYGLTAGIGYNLHTRNAGVYEFEARAYYGLSDIFANTRSDYFRASNYLNISLNLGWYFQLTGRK